MGLGQVYMIAIRAGNFSPFQDKQWISTVIVQLASVFA